MVALVQGFDAMLDATLRLSRRWQYYKMPVEIYVRPFVPEIMEARRAWAQRVVDRLKDKLPKLAHLKMPPLRLGVIHPWHFATLIASTIIRCISSTPTRAFGKMQRTASGTNSKGPPRWRKFRATISACPHQQ